jgi:type 1 glutamine amidotransferase
MLHFFADWPLDRLLTQLLRSVAVMTLSLLAYEEISRFAVAHGLPDALRPTAPWSSNRTTPFTPLLAQSPAQSMQTTDFHLLVFSKTAGYRHPSIADGKAVVQTLADTHNFAVTFSEEATLFTDATLAEFAGVVFLNTTGDILTDEQQAAFERYLRAGNGFVGVHSATDTEYDWPWYGGLVGAYFADHPAVQPATVLVQNANHPSTADLPTPWSRRDEWYNFQAQPTADNVLLTVDESSYSGGTMGADHPIAWYHHYDGGRAWYTAMGHTPESFAEPAFQSHLLGGILWAVGAADEQVAPDVYVVYLPLVAQPLVARERGLEHAPVIEHPHPTEVTE